MLYLVKPSHNLRAELFIKGKKFEIMRIRYKDFLPEIKEEGFFSNEYATLDETLYKVNEWIAGETVNVINIETVVLPNMADPAEAEAAESFSSGEHSTSWSQFIRVWYNLP
ncbi:MAG TPA: hypothetical protein VF599_20030 [Pyrinomonadaceae bacterium]